MSSKHKFQKGRTENTEKRGSVIKTWGEEVYTGVQSSVGDWCRGSLVTSEQRAVEAVNSGCAGQLGSEVGGRL